MELLGFRAAALERLREPIPQQTLRQQPRLLDQGQCQFGLFRIVYEFDHSLSQWRLAGGGANWALWGIVDDAVFGASKLLHAAQDLGGYVRERAGAGHHRGSDASARLPRRCG